MPTNGTQDRVEEVGTLKGWGAIVPVLDDPRCSGIGRIGKMIAVGRRVLLIIVTLLRELEENVGYGDCNGLLELQKRWFVFSPDL